MNVSITNDCNRRCEYCFQRQWYLPQKINDKSQIKEMSVTDFSDLIVWYMKSRKYRHNGVSLLGGEPLLHSQFTDIINILCDWSIPPLIISNISVDSSRFESIINSIPAFHWMINTDYPSVQRDTFIHNFKLLCQTNAIIGLSTTLLPNSKQIKDSANRILELINIYKDIRKTVKDLNIRISPYSPNPCGEFKAYDYSLDIVSFLNTVWSSGQISTNFDCRITYCELSENAIEQFKLAGIDLSTNRCSGTDMPFDVLVDGSCIWCSSANFLRLNNWRDYPNFEQAKIAMSKLWADWWKNTDIKCDYKNCGKFNPARCHGLCIAKNEVI